MTTKFAYQEPDLHATAQIFADELIRLHARMSWPSYKSSTLRLVVTYDRTSGPQVYVESEIDYRTIKHSALGPLMDEVYRRLDYDDKAEASISRESSTLRALPAPSDDPSDDDPDDDPDEPDRNENDGEF